MVDSKAGETVKVCSESFDRAIFLRSDNREDAGLGELMVFLDVSIHFAGGREMPTFECKRGQGREEGWSGHGLHTRGGVGEPKRRLPLRMHASSCQATLQQRLQHANNAMMGLEVTQSCCDNECRSARPATQRQADRKLSHLTRCGLTCSKSKTLNPADMLS